MRESYVNVSWHAIGVCVCVCLSDCFHFLSYFILGRATQKYKRVT